MAIILIISNNLTAGHPSYLIRDCVNKKFIIGQMIMGTKLVYELTTGREMNVKYATSGAAIADTATYEPGSTITVSFSKLTGYYEYAYEVTGGATFVAAGTTGCSLTRSIAASPSILLPKTSPGVVKITAIYASGPSNPKLSKTFTLNPSQTYANNPNSLPTIVPTVLYGASTLKPTMKPTSPPIRKPTKAPTEVPTEVSTEEATNASGK